MDAPQGLVGEGAVVAGSATDGKADLLSASIVACVGGVLDGECPDDVVECCSEVVDGVSNPHRPAPGHRLLDVEEVADSHLPIRSGAQVVDSNQGSVCVALPVCLHVLGESVEVHTRLEEPAPRFAGRIDHRFSVRVVQRFLVIHGDKGTRGQRLSCLPYGSVAESGGVNNNEVLAAIRDTFPMLDKWQDRTAEVIEPAQGSELAIDDLAWPYLRTSSLVSTGLATAREHLHAVRILIEAGELFPAAASTLCRSALIGASLAVWLMEPSDRNERARRSLSLAAEDYKRHIQFGKDITQLPPDLVAPAATEQLDRLRGRRSQVMDLLDTVGGLIEVNLTDHVIPAALGYTIPDTVQRAQMLLRWRAMSGAAHALTWHYFGYDSTTATEVDPGGVGRVVVGGDIGRLAFDYFPPFHIASAGWRLFDQRSGLASN